MAVKTREQIVAQLTAKFGDDKSDDVIAIIEDVTDTISDYETKVNGDGTDWKTKYEQNDKEWREKYLARFNSSGNDDSNNNNNNSDDKKVTTFDELFKEGE